MHVLLARIEHVSMETSIATPSRIQEKFFIDDGGKHGRSPHRDAESDPSNGSMVIPVCISTH